MADPIVPAPTEFTDRGNPICPPIPYLCRACGCAVPREKDNYDNPFKWVHLYRGLCFTCDFWVDKIDPMWGFDGGTRFVDERWHHCHADSRGHNDGSIFVEKHGVIHRTVKIWHQGEVPERFRVHFGVHRGRVLEREEGQALWEAQEARIAAEEAERKRFEEEMREHAKAAGWPDDWEDRF